MKRREFLALVGATTLAFPRLALAQQAAKVPRVALVSPNVPVASMTATGNPNWAAFIQELARLGYIEGKTVAFERYTIAPADVPDGARMLVGSAPDLVYASGANLHALAIEALTKTLPVVAVGGDLIAQGVVTNLAHPGGSVTGIATTAAPDADGTNLELLAQAVPGARRVAYCTSGVGGQPLDVLQVNVEASRAAAQKLGLAFASVVFETPADEAVNRRGLAAALATNPDIIQFGISTFFTTDAAFLGKLTLDARVAAIAVPSAFAQAGGLLSYGSNTADANRKGAGYVALILQGAKPGDLPVLQPTVFDLLVNLKTANALGIAIPQSVLIRATEVIS